MLTSLGALRVTDRDAWKATLRYALAQAQGNRTHAAKSLGVARRTLLRWLAECPDVGAETIAAYCDTIVTPFSSAESKKHDKADSAAMGQNYPIDVISRT